MLLIKQHKYTKKKWFIQYIRIVLPLFTNQDLYSVQVFTKSIELQNFLKEQLLQNKSVGFVPTMGALHAGHGSLVTRAKSENDLVVVSIFVNPTQFNSSEDLTKYPRSIEKDAQFLENLGCDVVFTPEVEEIYTTEYELPEIALGFLDETMEGFHRPGHFRGVVQVVYRLFEIVMPTRAYFGLKDFQQVAVIRFMTEKFGLPVQIIACPTLRETDGLAMSSRNMRLNDAQREESIHISKTLLLAIELSKSNSPTETKKKAIAFFEQGNLELEYLEIVDPITLESLENEWVPNSIACIVAYLGEVRLIDNMELNPA